MVVRNIITVSYIFTKWWLNTLILCNRAAMYIQEFAALWVKASEHPHRCFQLIWLIRPLLWTVWASIDWHLPQSPLSFVAPVRARQITPLSFLLVDDLWPYRFPSKLRPTWKHLCGCSENTVLTNMVSFVSLFDRSSTLSTCFFTFCCNNDQKMCPWVSLLLF